MILINLLPEELRKKEVVKLTLPELPSKTTIKRVIIGLISIQLLLTIFSMYQHFVVLPGLQKKVMVLKAEIGEIVTQKEETIAIKSRLKQIAETTERKFYWSSFLNTLTGSVTKGVWLDFLSLDVPQQNAAKKKKAEAKSASAAKKEAKKPKKKDAKAKKKESQAKAKMDKSKADAAKAAAAEEAAAKKLVLKIRGSVYAPGQETATVGSFLKELKSNHELSSHFDEIELGTVTQRKIKEYDVYDFEISGKLKKDLV